MVSVSIARTIVYNPIWTDIVLINPHSMTMENILTQAWSNISPMGHRAGTYRVWTVGGSLLGCLLKACQWEGGRGQTPLSFNESLWSSPSVCCLYTWAAEPAFRLAVCSIPGNTFQLDATAAWRGKAVKAAQPPLFTPLQFMAVQQTPLYTGSYRAPWFLVYGQMLAASVGHGHSLPSTEKEMSDD